MRLLVIAGILFAQHQADQEKSKHPFLGDEARIEAGRKSFGSGCAGCHGPEGGGGRGPNLVERGVWHPVDDQTIFTVIQKGVGIMPASGLSDERAWEIVAFVRSLTSPAVEVKAPGDAAAGEKLFWGSVGCAQCHRVAGKGGFLGPDLTNIGRTSTLPKLKASILTPDEVRTPGYQFVSVTMRDGSKLEGLEKDRTNYNLQLQLADGSLRPLQMRQVESIVARQQTLMPQDYKTRLTREQIMDLVAYLRVQAVK